MAFGALRITAPASCSSAASWPSAPKSRTKFPEEPKNNNDSCVDSEFSKKVSIQKGEEGRFLVAQIDSSNRNVYTKIMVALANAKIKASCISSLGIDYIYVNRCDKEKAAAICEPFVADLL